MKKDRLGKVARIRYRGGVAGEEPHDIRMDEPLVVRIGGHRVCKGIERALEELEVGESCTLLIPPEEGYGNADPKLVQWYPRAILDHGYDMKKGSMIMWHSADGLAAKPAIITDATEDVVQIDLNHPYAGKTLEYWVELMSLE